MIQKEAIYKHDRTCCQFVASEDEKDYYICDQSFNGLSVIIRTSDEPSSWSQWEIGAIHNLFNSGNPFARRLMTYSMYQLISETDLKKEVVTS